MWNILKEKKETHNGGTCDGSAKDSGVHKNEVQAAIDTLEKNKANDCNGARAEDIEACSEKTKEMTKQIFNEMLKQEDCTPTTWRRIRIKVIHKKGDLEEAGNYRPLCTLPALYKLFSTFLCNRLCPRLDQCATRRPGWVQEIIPDV